ncbi:MAG: pimelyl-ACP methyl ester esterase BioV [Campylobacterales bacterium]
MRWFSGFGFKGEAELFTRWIRPGRFTVAGFSYGAILAIEYGLATPSRIDRLELLSPAFFQTRDATFRRLQLLGFERDPERYRAKFEQNCARPASLDLSPWRGVMEREALRTLLEYRWEREKLAQLLDRGIKVSIYLGSEDQIIDVAGAYDFFRSIAECWLIKGAGHLLLKESDES